MDLHIHSNLSLENTLSVEETLSKAQSEGLGTISIADHNTALAHVVLEHIDREKYFKGKIIPGAEVDTVADGVTFEILAYNFDIHPMQDWLYRKFATVEVRQAKIRTKLLELAKAKGFKFDKSFAWNPRKEFAHINVYNNLKQYKQNDKLFGVELADGSDFYRRSTTDKDFPLYLDMSFIWADIKEVIKVIHGFGGVAVLAHPFGYSKDTDVNQLLEICRRHGIDGVEVYHPKHTDENIKFLLEYAKKSKLLVTGGSDWHAKEGEEMRPFTKLKNLL